MTAPYLYKFDIGSTYWCRSVGDYNAIWKFKVLKRTNKTITIVAGPGWTPEIKRISIYEEEEQVRPIGNYSMAPILGAKNLHEDARGVIYKGVKLTIKGEREGN